MNHVPAWLALLGLIAAILGCIHEENGRNQGLPMVASAFPSCPKLANPCDRVNCNRVNTKVIA